MKKGDRPNNDVRVRIPLLARHSEAEGGNDAVSLGERARLGRSEPRPRGSHKRSNLFHHLVTSHATNVRRGAHRTAAAAAALPIYT